VFDKNNINITTEEKFLYKWYQEILPFEENYVGGMGKVSANWKELPIVAANLKDENGNLILN
jgi:hypothetical protein